jgi:hypothetical protein
MSYENKFFEKLISTPIIQDKIYSKDTIKKYLDFYPSLIHPIAFWNVFMIRNCNQFDKKRKNLYEDVSIFKVNEDGLIILLPDTKGNISQNNKLNSMYVYYNRFGYSKVESIEKHSNICKIMLELLKNTELNAYFVKSEF